MTFTALSDLDRFKAGGFPTAWTGLPLRTFYSPVDDVHGVLASVMESAQHSLVVCMFAFDDDELADIVKAKLADPSVTVQLTLDSSQAEGAHEREILAREDYPASSIAIGLSEGGAIVHLKEVVVDGRWRLSGSTNLSSSGERLQDNELTVVDSPVVAQDSIERISAIHAHILAAGH